MFSLYKIFTSHAVLQREQPIVFSGYGATPHATVTAAFAAKESSTTAADDGTWAVTFPAMTAGGPYDFNAKCGDESVALNDLLIGDVWLCSGQSNMEMPLWNSFPFFRAGNGDVAAAAANYPMLRLYNSNLCRRLSTNGPLNDDNGPGWTQCTPDDASAFSACGFFFGRKLMQDLGIPIGLISSSWGGTDIAAWISQEKYEKEGCREFLKNRDKAIVDTQDEVESMEEFQALVKKWVESFNTTYREPGKEEYAKWLQPDYDDCDWDRGEKKFIIPEPGEKIYRCTFELPPEMANQELQIKLGIINDVDETYLNGKLIGSTTIDVPGYWNVSRNYTIPAGVAKAGRNVLAIVHDNHYAAGSFSPQKPVTIEVKSNPAMRVELTQWCAKTAFVVDSNKIGVRPTENFTKQNIPCVLFDGMINPWLKYAIRGVIWYQGCHNNGQRVYYVHHRYLIEDWRHQWHNPNMPFFLVQLAGYTDNRPENRGPEDQWMHQEPVEEQPFALIREIQAEIPKLFDNVGMAVTMDIGDQYDIHPRDKQTLGERLACEAERVAYKMPVVSQGPEFDHFTVEDGGKVRVFFKHTDGGLCTRDGKAPGAFALGDDNGVLRWANAAIDGDTVVVSTPDVAKPTRVRYAYAGYRGDCNLMNGAGFPAVPFRSDKGDYTNEVVK